MLNSGVGVRNTPNFKQIFFFAVLGIEPRGVLTSALHPRPYFLYFILKLGLMKLWRASLSRERETGREGERERERET